MVNVWFKCHTTTYLMALQFDYIRDKKQIHVITFNFVEDDKVFEFDTYTNTTYLEDN